MLGCEGGRGDVGRGRDVARGAPGHLPPPFLTKFNLKCN